MGKLIRGLYNLRSEHLGSVATIGNFDGVHLGHEAVLKQLVTKAAELQSPSLLITFEPTPDEFFISEEAPARLTRFREKIQNLCLYSVNWILCLQFNRSLAAMEAKDFIRSVLVDRLRIRYLVAGDDFRFGRGRQGNFALLQEAGRYYGFEVAYMNTFYLESERVSSTRIRSVLARGDFAGAEKLLGRPYSISGRIIQGDKRGRTLGFPTANISLRRLKIPFYGVFAVEVYGLGKLPLPGVANLGMRPTVEGRRPLLEVHLLNFKGNIYYHYVQVVFLYQLRQEERFNSLSALCQQIEKDCVAAKNFFATR
ncbi:riboflavin biosynthesis protein RibF [Candidatus Nitrosoglobus terrae]|uniref:Riboflavin biosynthesis protein n=1 Tax=Candidatus Nitrosoglobus terrae TaxID=1630141 RepID=A0A1Q2SLV3_9GAMM|nr:bifunctional riboflavin kinase/FAD synthetase [Candidatus Nitrosoglobus terrae]BAW80100.1 riboflavin biosynthesis protein RibF [Candidatus Nitrosoglobus terrae]